MANFGSRCLLQLSVIHFMALGLSPSLVSLDKQSNLRISSVNNISIVGNSVFVNGIDILATLTLQAQRISSLETLLNAVNLTLASESTAPTPKTNGTTTMTSPITIAMTATAVAQTASTALTPESPVTTTTTSTATTTTITTAATKTTTTTL